MEEPFQLSDHTKQILLKRLKAENLDDVLQKKFLDYSAESVTVSREKAEIYNKRTRGSVRLRSGRYYTALEYKEWIKKVKAIKLP